MERPTGPLTVNRFESGKDAGAVYTCDWKKEYTISNPFFGSFAPAYYFDWKGDTRSRYYPLPAIS